VTVLVIGAAIVMVAVPLALYLLAGI